MTDQEKEHWLLLCEQAATEQDPEKLMDLLDKVNRFLEAEEKSPQRFSQHATLD